MKVCEHIESIEPAAPHGKGCEECMKTGDVWIHLRACLTCGHVGCCDSSKNHHATKHFEQTRHPIMKSMERGENWGWCFIDQQEIDF